MSISDLELDRPVLAPGEPVTGSLAYEVQGESPAPCCLRADFQLALQDETSWYLPPESLSPWGRIRFAFNRVSRPIWPPIGTHCDSLAVFLRVYTRPPSDGVSAHRPISSTGGALVQLSW